MFRLFDFVCVCFLGWVGDARGFEGPCLEAASAELKNSEGSLAASAREVAEPLLKAQRSSLFAVFESS